MYFCTQPIPNCNNANTIEHEYTSFNKTSQDCWAERQKFISGRIYLTIAIFNALCIVLTTSLFIYCALLPSNHPIRKKSIPDTILGSVGHLIFSTSILLSQSLNGVIGCQLILWAVLIGFYTWMFTFCTRAFRLRFLFRLNRSRVKYLRMTTSERFNCLKDKDYRWYINNRDKTKINLMKPYIIYFMSILIIFAVALPLDLIYTCSLEIAAIIALAYYIAFIAAILPIILWNLKDNADAHGIRTELLIDGIVGIPILVIYLIFYFILTVPKVSRLDDFKYRLFLPGNWIVIYTASAHILSVVIPVLSFLPIQNRYWIKLCDTISKHCLLKKRYSSTSALESLACIPELSMDSLESCLTDPYFMNQLQDLAIRDFSSENLLFYEKYLELDTKFQLEYFKSSQNTTSRQWRPIVNNTNIEYKKGVIKYLSTPIPYKMLPAFITFYETFIKENTSSQVNISYRARHAIDIVFQNLYQIFPELDPARNQEAVIKISSTHPDTPESKYPEYHDDTILTMGIFEPARVEVCWNIFNSVYPKLVDMYATQQ